jgi:hypothetical protein
MNHDDWNTVFNSKRIYLNIEESGQPVIGRLSKQARVRIPLDDLLYKSSSETLDHVQQQCKDAGIVETKASCDLAVNALQMLNRIVPVAELADDKAVEDVTELYRRLNQQGTRVREPQIMLAYVAQYNLGWVRDHFYPFLDGIKEDWELDAAQVLQVATILAEGKARVATATKPDMWKDKVIQLWPRMKKGIEDCILHLWDEGITDVDMVPSSYTMIMLLAIHIKFCEAHDYDFKRVLRWFILANLDGRYGDAPLEQLTKDGREVYNASNLEEALGKLNIAMTKQDLSSKLNDSFRDNSPQALLLHILLWSSEAKDWLANLSLRALTQSVGSLEPHWHHILPKEFAKKYKFDNYDKSGNLTRLCGETNVRKLKKTPPWEYVPTFNITEAALRDHLIPAAYIERFIKGQPLSPNDFNQFISERQNTMTEKAASYLDLK